MLRSAVEREQRERDGAEGRRRQKEQSQQRARDREDEGRRQKEKDHVREVVRLSRPTTQIRYAKVQSPKPEPSGCST